MWSTPVNLQVLFRMVGLPELLIFTIRDGKNKTDFPLLDVKCIFWSVSCTGVWRYKWLSRYRMVASARSIHQQQSLEYNLVFMEDGEILNLTKRNTSMNTFFNSLVLIKLVLKTWSLRFTHNSLKVDILMTCYLLCQRKMAHLQGCLKLELRLVSPASCTKIPSLLLLYAQVSCPLPVLDMHRTLRLLHYMLIGASVLCSFPNPLVHRVMEKVFTNFGITHISFGTDPKLLKFCIHLLVR